ncbi:hypothetical protein GCK72_022940 [Caenorhabditis remanei]|nr:hypothetical protein GCK72_022940 [Caenorhabditis remanei]KAF1746484.1 hypothetical protein GCK72_022940 [Caenorhabditis remanei]
MMPLLNNTPSRMTVDDFLLLKVLGKGAYGKVFQARKKDTNQVYALKVVGKPDSELESTHLKDEIRILENVKSPFICQMFHRFETKQSVYMVLELLSGGELFNILNREKSLTEDATRYYVAQIALGLEHLHNQNVVYRDLKAINVMLGRCGNIKLTDFGLSKFNFIKGSKTSTFCGTYEGMAPELMRRVPYDHSVDIWALGILMYDMMCGGPPFTGDSKEEIKTKIQCGVIKYPKKLSSQCKTVIKALLTRNVQKRITLANLKTMDFFRSINWEKLEEGKFDSPPFIPELKSDDDVSHFDTCFTDLPPIESPCKKVREDNDCCADGKVDDAFDGFEGTNWFTSEWNSNTF